MNEIFWSLLPERYMSEQAVTAALALASHCGSRGYSMLAIEHQRTDMARNRLVAAFLELAKNDNDVLVMLDCDHAHPRDTVQRLVANDPGCGVVGALAFRRTAPHDPCFFLRKEPDKPLLTPLQITGGLMKCAVVGTGAIAIRRWVFTELDEAGFGWPYFQYYYHEPELLRSNGYQSEDVFFGLNCEKARIAQYCDTSLIIPHLITSGVDERAWAEFAEKRLAENSAYIEYVKET